MWNDITFDIDIKKKNYLSAEVNQNDDLHFIIFLYENGKKLSLDSSKDSYKIKYINANNTITSTDMFGGGFTDKDNCLSLYGPRNCTASAGTAHTQITLIRTDNNNSGKQTTTFPIDIEITPSVIQGQEISKNASNLIGQLDASSDRAEGDVKKIDKAITDAESNLKDISNKYPPASLLALDVVNLKNMGVRNLFKHSKTFGDGWNKSGDAQLVYTIEESSDSSSTAAKVLTYKNLYVYSVTQNWAGMRQWVELEAGKTYTLSVYLKAEKAGVNANWYCSHATDTTKNFGNLFVSGVSTEWTRYTATIKPTESTKWLVRVEPANITTIGGDLYVCGLTLVEGAETPKDWFPESNDSNERIQLVSTDDILQQDEGKYQGMCANAPNTTNNWLYDVKVYAGNSNYKKIIAYNVSSNTTIENTCNNGVWTGWKSTLLQSYPIGKGIIINADGTNPGTYLMGSTWQQIAPGCFLVGIGQGTDQNGIKKTFTAGVNNGEYQHTQTIEEMPNHHHGQYVTSGTDGDGNHGCRNDYDADAQGHMYPQGINTDDMGGGQPFNITPPGYGIYVWLRTA